MVDQVPERVYFMYNHINPDAGFHSYLWVEMADEITTLVREVAKKGTYREFVYDDGGLKDVDTFKAAMLDELKRDLTLREYNPEYPILRVYFNIPHILLSEMMFTDPMLNQIKAVFKEQHEAETTNDQNAFKAWLDERGFDYGQDAQQ